MKLRFLPALPPLVWLIGQVLSAPTGYAEITDVTTPGSKAPIFDGESSLSTLSSSTTPVEVQVRDDYLVFSPHSDLDPTVEDRTQVAERGVTLAKRVDLFWYFPPPTIMWACVVAQSRFVGIPEHLLGYTRGQNPSWTRGLLPAHLIPTFMIALGHCCGLHPDECWPLATYIDEFGIITTIPQYAWLSYIITPVLFQRPPRDPPPPTK